MKNPALAAFSVALWISGFGNPSCAQNDAPPSPPLPASPAERPLHEQATAEAWAAYQAGESQKAITNAERCITAYRETAIRSQTTLESKRVTLPKGKVSEADKERIASYQILHDVATCYLIKGWAEEKLGRKEEAKKAFVEAKKLTHARCSRPTADSFWSPAEKASERLNQKGQL